MKPGDVVTVGESKYKVLEYNRAYVTYQPWRSGGWAVPVTVVRSRWLTLIGWVGPEHAAPGWATADGDS
jgi:hypothetical protein